MGNNNRVSRGGPFQWPSFLTGLNTRKAGLAGIGFLAGIAGLVLRYGYGIGFRPLLNLVETMVISGIALFGFGFVGEMVAGMREEVREIAREVKGHTNE